MSKLIAIIDDEPDIVELVDLHLKKAGFMTKGFFEAESFYRFLSTHIPDLIILDLMLPDADGFEICKYLKKQEKYAQIPVVMLTAKADETDKVLGLELGADDYVTKPFSTRELIARVKAVLRRKVQKEEEKIVIGDILTIDLKRFEVVVEKRKVELTSTEFKILQLLSSKQGWVFSRDNILQYLWGHEKTVVDRTVDVHVRHLREKLGKAAYLVKNIRGIGYKIEA